MLRSWRDLQSLIYLLALPLLVAWQWRRGFSWLAYGVVLFLTLGVGVIHHNHAHLPMWRSRWLNRLTDLYLSLLQGHPGFVFHCSHMANHHRYRQGPQDMTRTWRFGDHNHLAGYLLHPLQVLPVLYPHFAAWLARLRRRSPAAYRRCLLQYAAVLLPWGALAWLDWQNWLLLVLLPQLHGLHWLLATNYLQHAHADGHSRYDYARNFAGWVNPLLFNIGLHTAHHEHPHAHWSTLPTLHAQLRHRIDPRLQAGGLLPYMFRTFLLGPLLPRHRSHSLMTPPETR
ncbi:Fatty acid desaturase [Andreprevotia lacus DSM 23236]|jgi:fatty acid desaturase|uniref:Fatty acid desaturase n=1 Tax=Andreprevotia lacus DSM 23236 TaxID=1121001 RepID=A0A1W1XSZ7_9NEIS|nr:fatty acid desaturase [Andreprevotia lacus]SMC27089.1 Fatty acid desaturase [Andreprevotia lacus DSM 23236]